MRRSIGVPDRKGIGKEMREAAKKGGAGVWGLSDAEKTAMTGEHGSPSEKKGGSGEGKKKPKKEVVSASDWKRRGIFIYQPAKEAKTGGIGTGGRKSEKRGRKINLLLQKRNVNLMPPQKIERKDGRIRISDKRRKYSTGETEEARRQ